MTNDKEEDGLVIASDEVNVAELNAAYNDTVSDLGWYVQGCKNSQHWRNNQWAGKSTDLRKNTVDAFPFKGASDTEVHIISQRVNTYVAMFMSSLKRANIRAYPVESSDMAQSKVTSNFLKWMMTTYMPDFYRQIEQGANGILDKGIAITYVGWEKRNGTYKQMITLDEIMAVSPDLVKMILDGANDDKLVEMLNQQFLGMTDKKSRKAIRDLRKDGVAEFNIIRVSVDRPCVENLTPDGDWFFPSYTTNPQEAPYCFRLVQMTKQQLLNQVSVSGWDADYVDDVIESAGGKSGLSLNLQENNDKRNELYSIVYCYRRMIDEEDGSQGIYCTVFAPDHGKDSDDRQNYAKHELMNGYDDYPVVVTKLNESDCRLYEVLTMPEQLRGCQWQVKIERDSRIDRNSMTTLPAVMHPINTPKPDMSPGGSIAYRRQGEIGFAPTPPYNPGSVEIEQTLILEADRTVGLDLDNPLSTIRQGFLVDKFLSHVSAVIKMAFKCYQRFGKDEVWFRVTGSPDPQRFKKGDPNQDFDIKIMFDVQMNDPENIEADGNFMLSLAQMDKNGRINMDELIAFMAASRNPILADAILMPAKQAQQEVTKNVIDDLSKIYAGIEVPARANGGQIALQVIQQYAQQPDVMQRLQADESFQQRMEKYVKQYTFQMQQAQNANEFGKLGTAKASMGDVNTQQIPNL